MLRMTAEGGARASVAWCPTAGVLRVAQDDSPFPVILGKYATAAGGRKRERVCGGERERKEAR